MLSVGSLDPGMAGFAKRSHQTDTPTTFLWAPDTSRHVGAHQVSE